MKFVTINDSLAPIRLLRQAETVDDAGLDRFLSREHAFKREATEQGERWLDVFDCREFTGLDADQREAALEWLSANVELFAETSLGVAIAVPPQLEGNAQRFASVLAHAGVPTHVGTDLESALYWALDRVYDEEVDVAPALVLGGIDALRQTLA